MPTCHIEPCFPVANFDLCFFLLLPPSFFCSVIRYGIFIAHKQNYWCSVSFLPCFVPIFNRTGPNYETWNQFCMFILLEWRKRFEYFDNFDSICSRLSRFFFIIKNLLIASNTSTKHKIFYWLLGSVYAVVLVFMPSFT